MPSLEALVLKALLRETQKKVAEAIGVEPTNFSRFINNNGHNLPFSKVCEMFDVLALEVVDPNDASMVCVSREELQALRTLARKGLEVA